MASQNINLVFSLLGIYLLLSIILRRAFSCPAECLCVNDQVVCNGLNILKVPDGIPTDTDMLKIQETSITQVPVTAFNNLINLKKLYIQRNKLLNNLPPGLFDNLTSITTIYLSYNNISTLPSGLFKNLPNLERIVLKLNKISSVSGTFLRNLPKLSHLDLERNKITSLPFNLLNNSLPSLDYLALDGNLLSTFPDGIFRSVGKILKTLLLRNNKFKHMPMKALKVIENLESISVLHNKLDCNCSLKEFADWAKDIVLDSTSCSDGVQRELLKIDFTHCVVSTQSPTKPSISTHESSTQETSTKTISTQTISTQETPTKKTPQDNNVTSLTTLVTRRPSTLPPDDGDTESQDSIEDRRRRKTLILAISISAVTFVVLVAFILCLFHTGILSSRCNKRFQKNKLVILDADGKVLVKDGQVVT